MLQLALSTSSPCDFSNLGFARLKVFYRLNWIPPAHSNHTYFLHSSWILKNWGYPFHNIYLSLPGLSERVTNRGTSHGVPPLLSSSLIIPLLLARMAVSPDAGACWGGGWPVVSADRPWRVLEVIVGLEKYSFNIFDQGIGYFFFFIIFGRHHII